jgi:hypothetical protein
MSENKMPQIVIVDDPAVREVYANKVIGTMFDGGALSITMGVGRFVPNKSDEPIKKGSDPVIHVTARITLSPGGAIELSNALNLALKTLSQSGASRQAEADQEKR